MFHIIGWGSNCAVPRIYLYDILIHLHENTGAYPFSGRFLAISQRLVFDRQYAIRTVWNASP